MKTNREAFSGYIIMTFTCLLFVAAIQLSLGEVGWQILGVQPIPKVVDKTIKKQEVRDVAVLTDVVFFVER